MFQFRDAFVPPTPPLAERIVVRSVVTVVLAIAVGVCVSTLPAHAHEDVDLQIATLTQQLQRDPRNAELYLRRGELHRAHREWDAAGADYDRAAEVDPHLAVVDLVRGLLLLDAGRPAAAILALDIFLAKNPTHAAAHVARGRALAQLGQPAAAAAAFTRAISAEPSPQPEHYLERARLVAGQGDDHLGDALHGLDAGIKQLGPLVTLQLYAIELELRRQRYAAALARLDTIAAQSARQETWLARRGEILEQAGRLDTARAVYATALATLADLPPSARCAGAMAEVRARVCAGLVRAGGHAPEACDDCREAVSGAPE